MKDLTIRAIAAAAGGRYHGPRELCEREVSDVVIDSRKVQKDCLFVPIKGARADGHDFIPEVMAAGALVTLTERAEGMPDVPYIKVDSSEEALLRIAALYRKALDIPVVGITGSVGKTSTKEMIASVLSQKYRVLKTAGNFNNNIGLPLTIFRLREEDEIAVLEMGINHFGEMTALAETAEPDTMVITNIGTCHLEFLQNRDGVFKAKTECFDYVKLDGTVILNGDDDKLIAVEEVHGRRPVFFGLSPRFRVYADEIRPLGLAGTACRIHLDEEELEVTVPLPGEHMVRNALAGAAVGAAYGLTLEEIRAGIESLESLGGRFHLIERGPLTVIDDCYNANPMSMKASLSVLKDAAGQKTAVLGDMGELGPDEAALHREVGAYAGTLPIDLFVTAGPLSAHLAEGIRSVNPEARIVSFPDTEALLAELQKAVPAEGSVLVKASHYMGFERVVKALTEETD